MTGESDSGNRLIDHCHTILIQEVRYISWKKCISRAAEVVDLPEDKTFQPDKQGYMRYVTQEVEPDADVSSDLRLDLVFRRRALAADVAGLMSYEAMHSWHEVLKAEYLRTPPPGFHKVSLNQLRAADGEVFRLVGERCCDGG